MDEQVCGGSQIARPEPGVCGRLGTAADGVARAVRGAEREPLPSSLMGPVRIDAMVLKTAGAE
jgi:hypothetical protein